jgi:hypothetical protein
MIDWKEIQYESRVKLRRTDHHRAENLAELRLLAQISQLMCQSLPHFVEDMQAWLDQTKMGNHVKFEAFYVLVQKLDSVEVWHCNANRQRDRHVCTVD